MLPKIAQTILVKHLSIKIFSNCYNRWKTDEKNKKFEKCKNGAMKKSQTLHHKVANYEIDLNIAFEKTSKTGDKIANFEKTLFPQSAKLC